MSEPELVIEAVDDPALTGPAREQLDRGRRNMDWLASHWAELLPQARGRFVVVAGQQAHVTDSVEAAWAWAKAHHPEDDGAIVQYVRPATGPRIYASRRPVVRV
jgi:hypothetical protein